MKIINSPNIVGAVGHDAPIQRPEEDLLNGQSVARLIHRLVRAAPSEWSTRIGLYGAWGSGKTSILNLLRQLEEGENSLVLSFSTWAVTEESGVIALFYETLEARLKQEGIKFSFKQHARHVTNKVKKFGWFSRLAKEGIEDWSPAPAAVTKIATKAAAEAAAFAVSWAKIDVRDIESLVQQLGGRRVVVFIDDLDRADPRVLPKTFLALRELLDWPGFTFILAFDKKVISKALSEYSAAFGEDVQGFLEKVIDIPVEVPSPNDGHKKRLAEQAFRACCDWMPSNTLDAVMKVLPSQPRRIKLIARLMGSLRPSLIRHEPAEIDWRGLCLFLILGEASTRVADWVLDAVTDRDDGWTLWARDKDERKQKENEARAAMRDLLNEPVLPADADRVIEAGFQLLQHWEMFPSEAINYWVHLGSQEPSLTPKEFRKLLDQFGEEEGDQLVSVAVNEGAVAAGITHGDAATDLLAIAVGRYQTVLDSMASARTQYEWESHYNEGIKALAFLEYLWRDCKYAAVSAVVVQGKTVASFLGVVATWLGWTRNEGECNLRERERKLALEAAASCVDPERLYLGTEPFFDNDFGIDPDSAEKRRQWRDELRKLLAPQVAEHLFAKFSQEDGLLPIASGDDQIGPWMIENKDSPLYVDPNLAQGLIRTFRQEGVTDSSVRVAVAKNATLYLKQILFQTRNASWGGVEHLKDIHARNPEIIPAAWMAIFECPVPFRMLSSLRKLRDDLIRAGVMADLLPSPRWLPPPEDEAPTAG